MTTPLPSDDEAAARLRAELRRLQARLQDTPAIDAELEQTRTRLAEARAELARVRGSASFQVGQLLVRSAKDPRRGVVSLPKDLVRMWRGRGSPTSSQLARQAAEAEARQLPLPDEEERNPRSLLSDHIRWAPVPAGRPVVGLVAAVSQASDLGAGAHVVALVPDRYDTVTRGGVLDVVVIEASAGDNGPWTGLGTGDVVERDRELEDLLARCAGAGIPTVVVLDRDPLAVPVLAAAAALSDVIVPEDDGSEVGMAARRRDPAGWLRAVCARADATRVVDA